jgi:hypothetical protein
MKKLKDLRVSQSMIKDVREYDLGAQCGAVIQSKYVTNTWQRSWNDSDAKALGRYFEFILTGVKPNGYEEEPKPKYMLTPVKKMMAQLEKKKKDPSIKVDKLEVKDMEKPYREVHRKVELLKKWLENAGIVLEACQVEFKATKDGVDLIGNIDIFARYRGLRIVIDVKFSGLLEDKWSPLGWALNEEQISFHGTQAKQYHAMTGLPFYWLIMDAGSNDNVKFIEAEIDEFAIQNHLIEAKEVLDKVQFQESIGWTNYPSFNKCRECPLKANCSDSIGEITPQKVKIT